MTLAIYNSKGRWKNMKKSFVASKLNLNVTEKINNKLVKSEEKLADAVVSNHKVKEKRGNITKILKQNSIKIDTKELRGCLEEFEASVKLLGVEFSITRNENLTIKPSPDFMFEETYNIDLSDIDEIYPEGDIIDSDYVEIVDESSPEEDDVNNKESKVVYSFVSENIISVYGSSQTMEYIWRMFRSDKETSNVIYNILRGDVPVIPIAGRFIDIFKSSIGVMEYRLIEPFLNAIIETLSNAVYDLNILTSSDDLDLVSAAYNRYESFLTESFETLLYTMNETKHINAKELVNILLAAIISPSNCKSILSLTDEDIHTVTVEETVNILIETLCRVETRSTTTNKTKSNKKPKEESVKDSSIKQKSTTYQSTKPKTQTNSNKQNSTPKPKTLVKDKVDTVSVKEDKKPKSSGDAFLDFKARMQSAFKK